MTDKKKFTMINLRVSVDEKEEIEKKIKEYDLTISSFLRQVVDAFMEDRLSIKRRENFKTLIED